MPYIEDAFPSSEFGGPSAMDVAVRDPFQYVEMPDEVHYGSGGGARPV